MTMRPTIAGSEKRHVAIPEPRSIDVLSARWLKHALSIASCPAAAAATMAGSIGSLVAGSLTAGSGSPSPRSASNTCWKPSAVHDSIFDRCALIGANREDFSEGTCGNAAEGGVSGSSDQPGCLARQSKR